ncbi:antibiotic biosynthesis monooxygenase family protein [Jatrophihabitans sp. YIM 134969]
MLSVVHLAPPHAGADLRALGKASLEVLSRRPGFVRGSLGRATDDADAWVLVTEWDTVGSYRRALGNAEVKMTATPLFYLADGAVSGFEQLVTAEPGRVADGATDLAPEPG